MDNDSRILDMMQEALSYEGFDVDTFSGTDDVVSLVKDRNPDLLIVDYILDGINGGEHCRRIKTCLSTANLPVIIFSAYPKVLQSLGYYGCNAFIAKPFDLSVLVNKVTDLIGLPKTRTNAQLNGY